MTELDLIKALDDYHRAQEKAKELLKQATTIWFDCIKEKYNLMEGSIVRFKGKEYRVSTIEVRSGFDLDKPWVKGNPKNSNGEWGIGERNLYNEWEVVQG